MTFGVVLPAGESTLQHYQLSWPKEEVFFNPWYQGGGQFRTIRENFTPHLEHRKSFSHPIIFQQTGLLPHPEIFVHKAYINGQMPSLPKRFSYVLVKLLIISRCLLTLLSNFIDDLIQTIFKQISFAPHKYCSYNFFAPKR